MAVNSPVFCTALVISAPNSGAGKTTVTAAMARYFTNMGKTVQVFKTGPDFIDPMILEAASNRPVYQLDLWMVGESECQRMLYQAAIVADLILIEGVMGLFDGTPNTADLSDLFGIPILAVIDGSAMAQSFGALVHGLVNYQPSLNFYGVIANKIAGKGHGEMVLQSINEKALTQDYFLRNSHISLPERHLGIMQAGELQNIDVYLEQAAQQFANSHFNQLPKDVVFWPSKEGDDAKQYADFKRAKPLKGQRILVAKDNAFSFLYRANLAMLADFGAELSYISPLQDKTLPEGGALYIPGGYPELYAQQLSQNNAFKQAVKQFAKSNKPVLAECGGMLYLLDELISENTHFTMCGVLNGKDTMNKTLSSIGQQYVDLSAVYPNIAAPCEVRGHSFHYSSAEINLTALAYSQFYPRHTQAEAIYACDKILASYMHWYFPSNMAFFVTFFNGGVTRDE